MQNIFATIRQEINDYIYNDIEPVDGYTFNQYETIKRIHLYLNSQFEDQSLYNGREKIFYNITTPRRDLVARFLDVDTKDIRVEERNPANEWATYFLNYELQNWMANNKFGVVLNDLADEVTSFGSVVLKKKKGAIPQIVDLRRLFIDPTVDHIQESRFITIKHILTPEELRDKVKIGWDKDKIESIIRLKQEKSDAPESYEDSGVTNQIRSSRYIEVYERYGYLPRNIIEGGKKQDEIYTLTIVAEPFMRDDKQNEQGVVLFKGEWKDEPPFFDFHFTKTKGRWLGVGVPESLFPAQERLNELANQRRTSMELSSMHLFQTADKTVYNNILTDLQNGDILKTKVQGSLQPLANEERNLPAFQIEEQNYTTLADRVSFSNDILSGGEIPSSTAATTVVVQNNNATRVHLQKRENFALFIRYFIKDFIIPNLVKEINQEHILKAVGDPDDFLAMDEAWVNKVAIREEIKNRMLNGKPTFAEDVPVLVEVLMNNIRKNGSKRFVKLAENYYKGKLDDFDVNIDGEQKDLAKLVQNAFAFYQNYAQNPELLNDPVQKALMLEWARALGLDTAKIELAYTRRQQKQVMGGMTNEKPKGRPQPGNANPNQSQPEQEIQQVL